jgi:hypothetical protein
MMPTLNAAQTATVSLTVPNAYITVDCSSGAVVEVSWVSAGSISGRRTVQNISEDVGPFADQTTVTLYCRSGTASYSTTGDQAAQAALQALVSAPWNQFPVSFDAALSRVCVFAQFPDGSYLCTDQVAANGNFARRLFKLTGDPTGAYTAVPFSQTAVFSNLKNVAGTAVFDTNSGIQNAWVAANGDVFFLWKNATTDTYFVHRAKAGTWTVGTDAGYSNFQACIDVGRYGGTHHTGIRVANARGFLDFVNSAGQRTILLADYNIHVGRDFDGGAASGDASIVWRSTDGGATFSIFLEFNTGGTGTHRIDHFHGVVRDPYTGLIYFMTGDSGSENNIIQWDGVSAAPAANASISTIAATPGWRIISGNELVRYTDLLFAPTCIYSIPDCDNEGIETTTKAFVSTVIDKNLGWVGSTAPVERLTDVPPVTAVRANGWSAVISFTGPGAERYFHVWTINGNPEAGASWSLVAKLRTYADSGTYPAGLPQNSFVDAAGDLWIGGVLGQGVQFSPEVQSASSVRLRPVARRGLNVYDLT